MNGIAENRPWLFKSETGATGPWAQQANTTYDALANTATLANVARFSTWTLGSPAAPLPVELVAFTTGKQGSTVQLKRQTASERNSARFEAERSPDGQRFGRIGEVAAQGTTASPTDYALLDEKLPAGTATLYYRLRQVDTDGKAAYSPVQVVQVGSKALLILWPNPAHGEVRGLGATAGAPLEVFDATGRRISTATAGADGTGRLALPAGLAAGAYVVKSGSQVQRLTVE